MEQDSLKRLILVIVFACGVRVATCKADFNIYAGGKWIAYASPSSNGKDFDVYDSHSGKWIWYLSPSESGDYDIWDAHSNKWIGYITRSGDIVWTNDGQNPEYNSLLQK